MKICKRMIALALSLIGLLGCFSGCSQEAEPSVETAPVSAAKGRYVQEEIPIPECNLIMDMVMLADGRLRFVDQHDGNPTIYTGSPDGGDWEASYLPAEVEAADYLSAIALHSDGSIFCSGSSAVADTETYEFHAWLIDPAGSCREIPISHPDTDPTFMFLITDCDFTEAGRLIGEFFFQELREIDLETGTLSEDYNDLGIYSGYFSCAGEDIYRVNASDALVHRDGKTEALSGSLGTQLIGALKAFEGMDKTKTALWKNSEGYLFFTTHEGLYSYVPEGSIVEELVSGARSSLGDPTFFPDVLVGDEQGVFYVLGNYAGGGCALMRFVYDPEAPTAAETQLRVYSLYADEDLQQMISQYQIAHPEVAIDLEIGVTGEDGITETDAIRALNTQILAGDGPDMIRLDGFSLDSYLEKDLLMDLSGILSQGEPLLEQITGCYGQDGTIRAVPTTFSLPVIYGPEALVSQVRDLSSLADAAVQAKEEKPEARTALLGLLPEDFADRFYDSCSAAWIEADGTLDAEKLTEFYASMKKLFDLDTAARDEMGETLTARRNEERYIPGDYTGISSSIMIIEGTQCITYGTLHGMEYWGFVLSADDYLDGYELVPLQGQTGNTFLPKRIMGILSTSANQEAAGEFLAFMLSDQVQSKDLSTGFPVNKTTFDREITEERTLNSTISSTDAEGNYVSYAFKYPEEYRRQALKGWVENLTTPASSDRIIRNAVIGQMNDCLDGKITPEQAAQEALSTLNLYLSE